MITLTNEMSEAGTVYHAAGRALAVALSNGEDPTRTLFELNAARLAGAAVGHPAFVGTNEVKIVDGRPFSETTVTKERAAQIMANAAAWNAR